jgi:protein tyrosine/serine phosphatase
MSTRIHSFDGIENFRDFGNYASRFGGHVVAARLFRSGHYARATARDLDALGALGVGLIADLRRPTERANDRVPRLSGFAGQIIENNIGDLAEGPHIAFMRQTDMSDASIAAYLWNYYSGAPFELRYQDLFTRYFQALASLDGATLVHCAAGKDRTGILVALTHDLLGVSEADTSADFLLTNAVMQVEKRMATFGPVLEKLIGRAPSEMAIRCFLGVDREYLAAMFAGIRQQCGSTESYVTRVLGVEAATVSRIRDRLLE